ncbi:MAG TPA: ADYC domain-containing protein [Kofleriaceae bacterium]|nr:ADYC domain-containing protein [Kofleriaceae bacterium]
MTRYPKIVIACLLALAATACATVGEDDPAADDSDPGLGVAELGCFQPGCQEQGRTLLSAVLDTAGYLSFPLTGQVGPAPSTQVPLAIGPAGLTLANGGPLPSGLKLTASNGAVVEILSVTSPAGEPGPQYELWYTKGRTNRNPCVNGTAIAIDGDFDATGHHDENTVGVPAASHRFSFACNREGVAYKCVDWGYPSGSDPTADAWKAHQVCTRAARADYCKNGTTHTLDETFVRVWDNYPGLGFDPVPGPFQGLGQWPPPPGVYKFESVWPEDEKKPPTCLGKDRWQSLEPGELDTCDVHPADPRNDTTAAFCEVMGHDAIPRHSIVFESKYTDLLLEDWVNGDDQAVSVTGYFPGAGSSVVGKKPFDNAAGFTHVQTLGTLLRSLPGSINEEDVIDVYTYDDGGSDHVLAGPTGIGWTPPLNGTMTWEGMVFITPPAIPATVPLYAYEHTLPGGGSDFYNGTEPADPDDDEQGLIGYILAPPE